MNARTMLRSTVAAVAIGVMVLGSPAGLALAVEKQEFKDECEAGGGTFSEDNSLLCVHSITTGPDKGKKIRVACSKTSNKCSATVIDANAPGPVMPSVGTGQQITSTGQLESIPGGAPRRP